MAKRSAVLVGLLTVVLVSSVANPALAQRGGGEVSRTGVIERFKVEKAPPCRFDTTAALDVGSGRRLLLTSSAGVDLDAYVGQRVTVYGEGQIIPAVGGSERCPDIDVSRVEPADPDGTTPDGNTDQGGTETPGGTTTSSSGSGGNTSGDGTEDLPGTGGLPVMRLAVGALLLVAGGLIVRRITR